MTSGALLREARLRAGLTQAELSARSGRDRAQIARWERDQVAPSFESLRELVHACGFDLSLKLEPLDTSRDEGLQKGLLLSPQERVNQMLAELGEGPRRRRRG
jgi:transcriptional regulator with XRE-family HTH domain